MINGGGWNKEQQFNISKEKDYIYRILEIDVYQPVCLKPVINVIMGGTLSLLSGSILRLLQLLYVWMHVLPVFGFSRFPPTSQKHSGLTPLNCPKV